MTTDEDTTFSALSEVSSFEGNASTAHEAIAMVTEHPSMPDNAMAHIASAFRPSIDNETERPSLDTERPSFDETERPSLDSRRPSIDSGRSSFDDGEEQFRSALADVTIEPEKSFYRHRRNVSSAGGASNRSSLRDYLSMERPGVSLALLV
jgi:hypothetical protein